MAARAYWKGSLMLSLVSCPVPLDRQQQGDRHHEPTYPGRGAASFTLRRRAGTQEGTFREAWAPDHQRIAARCLITPET